MMTHHIGDTARQRILKELTIRVQKQVADVTSPWYVQHDELFANPLSLIVIGTT